MVCHSLLQWTTFCQTSPPWPVRLRWPHMAWLSFIELDKAEVHVIRLASFLWLWFQSVCPLMPSLSIYQLTWVSLSLDVGYSLKASPHDLGHEVSPGGHFCASPLLSSLYIWMFSVHVLLKPSLKDYEHNVISTWNECNCVVVWTFFPILLFSSISLHWSL